MCLGRKEKPEREALGFKSILTKMPFRGSVILKWFNGKSRGFPRVL